MQVLQKVFSSTKCKQEKKSRSERKVSKKQLIEESDDDDEVISNFGGKNSTDDLSELDDKMETQSINDNFRNAFILLLELITILFERNMLLLFYQ